MNDNAILNIQVDDEQIKELMNKAIQERLDEFAKEAYFMTYEELCNYVRVSRPIIEERFIKNGLRFYKNGNKYLFKRREVDAFLDEITEQMELGNNDFRFFQRVKKGIENHDN